MDLSIFSSSESSEWQRFNEVSKWVIEFEMRWDLFKWIEEVKLREKLNKNILNKLSLSTLIFYDFDRIMKEFYEKFIKNQIYHKNAES